MPTGYTDGVGKGEVTEFRDYAMLCARAFGACILLRDEPLSSEIPDFEPSDYHVKALAEAEKSLEEFLAMNEAQRRQIHASEHAENVATADKRIAEIEEQRWRYEAMLAKAKAFDSPSPEHDNYAKFLVTQLTESISFDCGTSYYEELKQPVEFEKWHTEKIKKLRWDVEYHRKGHREEVERTESRNKWVRQLKDALANS